MTFWPKTNQLITGVLLILLMSVTLAIPSGSHLQFCFGDNGHFDVALNSCHDVPSPQQQSTSLSALTHHGECLDLTVVCDSSERFVRHSDHFVIHKTKTTNVPPQTSGLLASAFFALPTLSRNRISLFLSPQTSPSLHLASLRTIVLLI